MAITYTTEDDLDVDEFIDVLKRSTLAERRPVDEPDRIAAMIRHANLTICARDETGRLVGVARSLTDFSWCCYMSDIAVDATLQRQGIGREMMRLTQEAVGDGCTLLLLSAPAAMSYYPRIGMTKLDTAFAYPRKGA